MSQRFEQMDALTGQLWRELMLASLPIRVVSRSEFAEMTYHLHPYDHPPISPKDNPLPRKPKPHRVTEPPTGISVGVVGYNVEIRCSICTPRWIRNYGHCARMDKEPRAARGPFRAFGESTRHPFPFSGQFDVDLTTTDNRTSNYSG
jgi:hypothetical protein